MPFNYNQGNCSFVTALNPTGYTSQPGLYWFGDALTMKAYAGNAPGWYLLWGTDASGNGPPAWMWSKSTPWAADIVYEFRTCHKIGSYQPNGRPK